MPLPLGAEELAGSPTIDIGIDGSTGVRRFYLPNYDDFNEFIGMIIGSYAEVSDEVIAIPPIPFPNSPLMIPTRCNVVPFGDENSAYSSNDTGDLSLQEMSYHNGAIVTVTYETKLDDGSGSSGLPEVPDGTYLELEGDIGQQVIELTGRKAWYRFDSDKPIEKDYRLSMVMPTEDFTLTWNYVTRPPWAAIRSARGKVNDAAWLSPAGGTPYFGAQQVLFKGCNYNRQFQIATGGRGFWRLVYHFSAQSKYQRDGTPVGWNHVLYSDGTTTDWEEATLIKGVDSPPYLGTSFDDLFRYG